MLGWRALARLSNWARVMTVWHSSFGLSAGAFAPADISARVDPVSQTPGMVITGASGATFEAGACPVGCAGGLGGATGAGPGAVCPTASEPNKTTVRWARRIL